MLSSVKCLSLLCVHSSLSLAFVSDTIAPTVQMPIFTSGIIKKGIIHVPVISLPQLVAFCNSPHRLLTFSFPFCCSKLVFFLLFFSFKNGFFQAPKWHIYFNNNNTKIFSLDSICLCAFLQPAFELNFIYSYSQKLSQQCMIFLCLS